jgi:ligand-binding sensor domain-containing protein
MSVCACSQQIVVGTNNGLGIMDDSQQWKVYDHTNSNIPNYEIRSVLNSTGAIWAATYGGGLVKKSNDPLMDYLTHFNINNSGIPSNSLNVVKRDQNGHIWIGTGGHGLAKFDGSTWTVYNTQNSDIPGNNITSIYLGANNELLIGTYFNGFARFDGYNWLNYNTTNSTLPTDKINNIYQDGYGIMWISTPNGLVRYDGYNWNIFNEQTTLYHFNEVNDAAADEDGNIWFATTAGLGKIDSTFQITMYKVSNSGLPKNHIYDIHVDLDNNIWIGTAGGGLAVFNENRLALDGGKYTIHADKPSLRAYPNPTSDMCQIEAMINPREYSILRVYNQEGRIVKEITPDDSFNEQIKMTLDVSDLARGMYFVELNNDNQIQREKLVIL